jgi:hypothetical protein
VCHLISTVNEENKILETETGKKYLGLSLDNKERLSDMDSLEIKSWGLNSILNSIMSLLSIPSS